MLLVLLQQPQKAVVSESSDGMDCQNRIFLCVMVQKCI